MKVVLSGDRPTGALHLGHYVGSLKNRVILQEQYKTYIMIANVQALTDYANNPELVQKNVLQILEDYLAIGLSIEKCVIFVQSEIKALFEMTIYFMNLVSVARAQQNPTIKDEIKQRSFNQSIPCGFLCYPISQAADITAFQSDIIPVGEDQLPMIEQTNEIVSKFNALYSCNVLKHCEVMLSENSRLVGIDGKNKASKSLNNTIFLNDDTVTVKEKVYGMYTDPNHVRVSDPGNVENNVVFKYLDVFYEDHAHLDELKTNYRKGGVGDIYLKNLLIDALQLFLDPIRERRLLIQKTHLLDVLKSGNQKASQVADDTLSKMREVMCLSNL